MENSNNPISNNPSSNYPNSNSERFKRNVAYKLRIGDVLFGNPEIQNEKFLHLSLDGKKISRVNVIANVIERFDSSGDKKYSFITLDDGSGQISVKAFGDDIEKLSGLEQGETILVIGLLRYFNNQVYILPEIVVKKDPKYLLVRKLEVEKERSKNSKPLAREQEIELKERILEKIKESENGIEVEAIKSSFRSASPEMIDKEIQRFLEEGVIFEPRPGNLKYLG